MKTATRHARLKWTVLFAVLAAGPQTLWGQSEETPGANERNVACGGCATWSMDWRRFPLPTACASPWNVCRNRSCDSATW